MELEEHELLLGNGSVYDDRGRDWSRSIARFDRGRFLPLTFPRTVQLHLVVGALVSLKRLVTSELDVT